MRSDDSPVSRFLISLIERKTGLQDSLFSDYVNILFQRAFDHHSCISLANKKEDEKKLLSHPAVGGPTDKCPFIIFNNKLYFNKHFQLEREIASMLFNRAEQLGAGVNLGLKDTLQKVFGESFLHEKKVARLARL